MVISTCSRNLIDLHTHLSWAVKEFHVTIRNLVSHPHAGSIQTMVKSMESYIQNFTQIFDNYCTQTQRGPLFDPTTAVIIQDTMSRISEQFKGLCLLHAIALEMFKNLQPTNSSHFDHQGPPPQYTNSSDLGHQGPPSQNINSSDLDHQDPPPQTQDDSSDFGHKE